MCTSCLRRPAFYLRRASGEKLCIGCLEKSLIKHVKRKLGETVNPVPGDRFVSVIPPGRVAEGYALSILLAKLERRYGGGVTVAYPEDTLSETQTSRITEEYPSTQLLPYSMEVVGESGCYLTKDIISLAEAVTDTLPPIGPVKAYLLPFTLTDLNEYFLEEFFEDSEGGLHHIDSWRTGKGRRVVSPLIELQRADIIAYLVGIGEGEVIGVGELPYCRPLREVKRVVGMISTQHTELAYGLAKTLDKITSRSK